VSLKAPNSNLQAPEKVQAPSTQKWSFEVWSFSGAWMLGFGAFEWSLDLEFRRVSIDLMQWNRFTGCMRPCLFFSLILAALVVSGCASHHAPPTQPAPQSQAPSVSATTPEPIVTPDTSLSAKVVRYNSVGRFVVLSFPVGQLPQMGQMLFIYRAGMKVGEVKITGPQRDNDIVADLTTGDAEAGDDVRDQ
jgi:hypothetical protein